MTVEVDMSRSVMGSIPVWDIKLKNWVHYTPAEFHRFKVKFHLEVNYAIPTALQPSALDFLEQGKVL